MSSLSTSLTDVLVVAIIFRELASSLSVKSPADFFLSFSSSCSISLRPSTGTCPLVFDSISMENGLTEAPESMVIGKQDVLPSSDLISH